MHLADGADRACAVFKKQEREVGEMAIESGKSSEWASEYQRRKTGREEGGRKRERGKGSRGGREQKQAERGSERMRENVMMMRRRRRRERAA
eukprot:4388631-Pleurochrysis_carterae.AAC.3